VIEEIRFFVGMVPVVMFPFQRIRETLVSVSSRRVQTIALDFIIDGGVDAFDGGFFHGFTGLDPQLGRIASEYEGIGKTVVKLSADDPFILGSYLTDFKMCGVLALGSRIRDSVNYGDIRWFGGDTG
jgi:hypothetical protein